MFGWFKKKHKEPEVRKLHDLNHNELKVGDEVNALRYDLGRCTIIDTPEGIMYQSQGKDLSVHWTKMIDAANELQKVHKIDQRDTPVHIRE